MAPQTRLLLNRRQVLQTLGALGIALGADIARAEESPAQVGWLALQPLGRGLHADAITTVRRALAAFYQLELRVLPRVELPRSAYYPPRRRYRAERLLTFLERNGPKDADRILGLTAVDISTSKGKHYDWGILGLATIGGRTSVLSSFRCKRGTTTEAQVRARLGKVAVHEVGHTLGLQHCPTHGCLMEDARGTVTTTDREYDLCGRCRQRLAKWGRAARSDATPPWPPPH
jgi:archaemetzincin